MDLDTNNSDRLVSCLKALGGLVPCGSVLTEVIEKLIPNQRIDRISKYLEELNRRLNNIEMKQLKDRFTENEFLDLFEDSCINATRALGEERLKYLASILVNSIAEGDLKYSRSKRYLSILSELTDQEVVVLGSYVYPANSHLSYHEKHRSWLRPERASLASDDSLVEDELIYESMLLHLTQLGLLDACHEVGDDLPIPETDSRGRFKVKSYEATQLATKFIKFIELSDK